MKKKSILLLATTFIGSLISAQPFVNLTTIPTTDQDVVRSIPGSSTSLKRLGHLQSGTWASGWDTWSALGLPIVSTLGNAPNDQSLYGLTINNQGDRNFFGSRYLSSNRCDAVVAWGDDNWGNTSSNPDRLVFEFHDTWAGKPGTSTTIKQGMVMMPDPSNTGVFVGVGIYTPTEQLHTTQGVRHQGLVAGSVTDLVGIDATGKLWRTPMLTSSSLGNLCTAPSQNPIAGNYEIPLANNNFYFSADNTNTNKTNFGFPCGATPPGKLNVTTAFRSSTSSNESYSIYSTNTYATGINGVGVYGEANVPLNGNSKEYGVWGKAIGGRSTTGVFGQALSSDVTNGIGTGGMFESVSTNQDNIGVNGAGWFAIRENVGVNGQGKNGLYSYGGKFNSIGGSQINIGVSGFATPSGGSSTSSFPVGSSVGVYGQVLASGTDFAGYFDGDVRINGIGYITAGAWFPSDKQFKTDVNILNKSIETLMKLKPKSYLYDTKNKYGINFYDKKQFGFIAQELEEVIPELVKETFKPAMKNEKGQIVTESVKFKTVNYDGLIAFLVSGVQEQQTQIEKDSKDITDLKQQIAELKAMIQSNQNNNSEIKATAVQSVEISDKNAIVLNQNVPNPFAESTVISYNIPVTFTKAQINFTTNEGKVIKSVEITTSGKGNLNVFANDLSSGIYNYTLVIDGKSIETKKMIKQ